MGRNQAKRSRQGQMPCNDKTPLGGACRGVLRVAGDWPGGPADALPPSRRGVSTERTESPVSLPSRCCPTPPLNPPIVADEFVLRASPTWRRHQRRTPLAWSAACTGAPAVENGPTREWGTQTRGGGEWEEAGLSRAPPRDGWPGVHARRRCVRNRHAGHAGRQSGGRTRRRGGGSAHRRAAPLAAAVPPGCGGGTK